MVIDELVLVELERADRAFRLDFERTPASINGHHGKIGGLLLHVWEVAYIGRHMAKAMRAAAAPCCTTSARSRRTASPGKASRARHVGTSSSTWCSAA